MRFLDSAVCIAVMSYALPMMLVVSCIHIQRSLHHQARFSCIHTTDKADQPEVEGKKSTVICLQLPETPRIAQAHSHRPERKGRSVHIPASQNFVRTHISNLAFLITETDLPVRHPADQACMQQLRLVQLAIRAGVHKISA